MIATTIEQSKRLLELGVSPDTSDMYYTPTKRLVCDSYKTARDLARNIAPFINHGNDYEDSVIPAWSATALMRLLPSKIKTGEDIINQYTLDIRKNEWTDEIDIYQIAYGNSFGSSGSWHDMINSPEEESFVDAAFDMIVWLVEHDFIKTNKK